MESKTNLHITCSQLWIVNVQKKSRRKFRQFNRNPANLNFLFIRLSSGSMKIKNFIKRESRRRKVVKWGIIRNNGECWESCCNKGRNSGKKRKLFWLWGKWAMGSRVLFECWQQKEKLNKWRSDLALLTKPNNVNLTLSINLKFKSLGLRLIMRIYILSIPQASTPRNKLT